jgi:hypothetical protein
MGKQQPSSLLLTIHANGDFGLSESVHRWCRLDTLPRPATEGRTDEWGSLSNINGYCDRARVPDVSGCNIVRDEVAGNGARSSGFCFRASPKYVLLAKPRRCRAIGDSNWHVRTSLRSRTRSTAAQDTLVEVGYRDLDSLSLDFSRIGPELGATI